MFLVESTKNINVLGAFFCKKKQIWEKAYLKNLIRVIFQLSKYKRLSAKVFGL
ncbi:MAG: hypothetical protein ACJA2M_002666 [Polaribacter sp.]|jgi:hypothetical protein